MTCYGLVFTAPANLCVCAYFVRPAARNVRSEATVRAKIEQPLAITPEWVSYRPLKPALDSILPYRIHTGPSGRDFTAPVSVRLEARRSQQCK